MPIVSRTEFEAVLAHACIKLDKVIYERGGGPAIEDARRTIALLGQFSKDPVKLKALRPKLELASEVVANEIASDEKLREGLWDCLDYLDYRV